MTKADQYTRRTGTHKALKELIEQLLPTHGDPEQQGALARDSRPAVGFVLNYYRPAANARRMACGLLSRRQTE